MLLLITFAAAIVAFFTIYFNLKHHFNYFKRHNVNHVKPTLILGNLKDLVLMRKDPVKWLNSLYHNKKAKHQPYIGFFAFNKPGILVREPELIKQIVIKDFQHFTNRYTNIHEANDSLAGNSLFFSRTMNWESLHTQLSSVFTSRKMKLMFPLFDQIGNNLNVYLNGLTEDKGFKSKDIKEICALFTAEVISSVAFGVEANTLRNPACKFRKNIESLFSISFLKTIYFVTVFFAPGFVKYIKPNFCSKHSKKFLENAIESAINTKEMSKSSRNDLIDILISSRKGSDKFKDNAIISQAVLFFSTGFESSLAVMSFSLYELAKNETVQNKLRAEIKNTLNENEGMITYEMVNIGMPYLNNVIYEVLRLYPAVPFIDREVTLLEGENEYNFEPFGDYKASNGTPVYIPIVSIHRNRNFFPNPNVFDPERFSPENKIKIISGSYLPFGIETRNGLGERFGLLQVKVGLINFLKGHSLKLNTKSHKDMVFNNYLITLQSKGGIHLDIFKEN